MLAHDDVGEDVVSRPALDEGDDRHDARPLELDLNVKREQRRDHVREAHARVERAAHRGKVAELRPHDVAHGLGEDAAGGGLEALVVLKLGERHHGADAPRAVGLLYAVEPAAGEVDPEGRGAVGKAQPHHAADDRGEAVLPQEVVGLPRGRRADVPLEGEHVSSLVVWACVKDTAGRRRICVRRCTFAAITRALVALLG